MDPEIPVMVTLKFPVAAVGVLVVPPVPPVTVEPAVPDSVGELARPLQQRKNVKRSSSNASGMCL